MVDKNIQMKHKNGSTWDDLFPNSKAELIRLKSGKTIEVQTSEFLTSIGNKVDKIVGKGLSENDFTTAEKTKLEGLKNLDGYTKTEVDSKIEGVKTNSVAVQKLPPSDTTIWFEELV